VGTNRGVGGETSTKSAPQESICSTSKKKEQVPREARGHERHREREKPPKQLREGVPLCCLGNVQTQGRERHGRTGKQTLGWSLAGRALPSPHRLLRWRGRGTGSKRERLFENPPLCPKTKKDRRNERKKGRLCSPEKAGEERLRKRASSTETVEERGFHEVQGKKGFRREKGRIKGQGPLLMGGLFLPQKKGGPTSKRSSH